MSWACEMSFSLPECHPSLRYYEHRGTGASCHGSSLVGWAGHKLDRIVMQRHRLRERHGLGHAFASPASPVHTVFSGPWFSVVGAPENINSRQTNYQNEANKEKRSPLHLALHSTLGMTFCALSCFCHLPWHHQCCNTPKVRLYGARFLEV